MNDDFEMNIKYNYSTYGCTFQFIWDRRRGRKIATVEINDDKEIIKLPKFKLHDMVKIIGEHNKVYKILLIQGNDYYTCMKLDLIFKVHRYKYIETPVITLVHALDLKEYTKRY